ncbi:hypothetical protein [Sedimentibacter sp.]|uniref:hypothetical protein n=1 Tax=Sedimentibacter sp. TaxID=1960295 RepID=UPI000EC519E8|nr:hypothetical protein [Sedimentibacter sp.]HCX61315.1 hypothetical protein [Clostridiales bacterium]
MSYIITEKHEISRLQFTILQLRHKNITDYACETAISAGYHPTGYMCINPRITAENGKRYICWERMSCCD